jgi:hypothetical protein
MSARVPDSNADVRGALDADHGVDSVGTVVDVEGCCPGADAWSLVNVPFGCRTGLSDGKGVSAKVRSTEAGNLGVT